MGTKGVFSVKWAGGVSPGGVVEAECPLRSPAHHMRRGRGGCIRHSHRHSCNNHQHRHRPHRHRHPNGSFHFCFHFSIQGLGGVSLSIQYYCRLARSAPQTTFTNQLAVNFWPGPNFLPSQGITILAPVKLFLGTMEDVCMYGGSMAKTLNN